jgi:hypothetical protein
MSFKDILDTIHEDIENDDATEQINDDTKSVLDMEHETIEKPKRRGRPPLSDKQKKALEKGRRNHQLRMAKKKIEEIEQKQKEEIQSQIEVSKPQPKPKPSKKQMVIYESSSEDDQPKVVIVKRKKKKKKPKKKIVYESSSSEDDSDIEPQQPIIRQETQPAEPPPFRHPLYRYRGGMFR